MKSIDCFEGRRTILKGKRVDSASYDKVLRITFIFLRKHTVHPRLTPPPPPRLLHVLSYAVRTLRCIRDDAGVVYVASLLFDEDMMARLSKSVRKLQPGARVISLRPIPAVRPSGSKSNVELAGGNTASGLLDGSGGQAAAVLRLLFEGVFRMSWQMARVYIYVRL